MKKIAVGIIGATGMVGQQYLQLLEQHPWFDVQFLASSDQSSGKSLREALATKGSMLSLPERFLNMPVFPVRDVERAASECSFVFSALSNEAAKEFEEQYAKRDLPVLSNASCHRMAPDVPVVIPEINPEHFEIISAQRKRRGWKRGFITAKPNCSIQSYMIPLTPLHQHFQLRRIHVTTMQAISGAGYPGVSSFDIVDNVVPFIKEEEEKTEREPLKIWGTLHEDELMIHREILITAHCNRVPVLDGHMACLSVEFARKPTLDEVLSLWRQFKGLPQKLELPSAPKFPIHYFEQENRPQTRLDRDLDRGMAVAVGRLRPCALFDIRFVGLSHNTVRGAAGGGILNAELLVRMNYLGDT